MKNAGLRFSVEIARIDEEMVRASLIAESATPRDIADVLAEMKAQKISEKHPEALVIGCDQVLDIEGDMLSKPETPQIAVEQLKRLQNKRHSLLSAIVICKEGKPVWRHIGQVRMHMRALSDGFIESYVSRNWESIRHSVGAYKLEEEGVSLFSRVEGDYFNVLGMPVLELISYLILSGELQQ